MKINTVLSILAISTALVSTAYAGTSDVLKQSVNDVPCDNVEYPVAISVHPYGESAGNTVQLNPNIKTTLTATNTKTDTNTLSDSYSHKTTITLGFEPKVSVGGVEGSTIKGAVAYEWGSTKTITKGQTVSFSSSDSRTLTPLAKNMTATPVFFKSQIWGTYYKCASGSSERKKVSHDSALELDIVNKQGWVFTCPDRKDSACDSKLDWKP